VIDQWKKNILFKEPSKRINDEEIERPEQEMEDQSLEGSVRTDQRK